jgi:hypothetical protein
MYQILQYHVDQQHTCRESHLAADACHSAGQRLPIREETSNLLASSRYHERFHLGALWYGQKSIGG